MLKLTLVICVLCSILAHSEAATNQSESFKSKEVEPCILDAVFSALYPRSYLPTDLEALGQTCKRQTDAFKCIKDKSRGAPALVRRGLLGLVSGRQRANKKLCNNINSEQSKRTIQDFKCIREKRFQTYRRIETEFANSMIEIQRKNFNDTAKVLNYFCCTTYKYRREYMEAIGPECSSARQSMTDVISSTIVSELNLICEDEEKLTKICAELEPLKVSKEFDLVNSPSPSLTGLLLIATLGESGG